MHGIYLIWGKCGEEIIRSPKPTNFKSFVEIYANSFKITGKAINFEDQKSAPIPDSARNRKENILQTQTRLEEENGEKVYSVFQFY